MGKEKGINFVVEFDGVCVALGKVIWVQVTGYQPQNAATGLSGRARGYYWVYLQWYDADLSK